MTRCPEMEAVKVMEPGVFCAMSCFATACATRKEPVVFTSSALRHCAGVISRA